MFMQLRFISSFQKAEEASCSPFITVVSLPIPFVIAVSLSLALFVLSLVSLQRESLPGESVRISLVNVTENPK